MEKTNDYIFINQYLFESLKKVNDFEGPDTPYGDLLALIDTVFMFKEWGEFSISRDDLKARWRWDDGRLDNYLKRAAEDDLISYRASGDMLTIKVLENGYIRLD